MKNSVIEILTRKTVVLTQVVLVTMSVLAIWVFSQFDVSDAILSDSSTISIQLNRYEFFLVLILLFLNVATAYALFRKFNRLNRLIRYSTGLMIATFLLLCIWLGRMMAFNNAANGQDLAAAVDRMEVLMVMVLIFASIMATTFLFRQFHRVEPYVVMSAYSKKIQYRGQWITIEEYFRRELGLAVSHGITPDEKDAALAEFNRQMAESDRIERERSANRPKAPSQLTPNNGKA